MDVLHIGAEGGGLLEDLAGEFFIGLVEILPGGVDLRLVFLCRRQAVVCFFILYQQRLQFRRRRDAVGDQQRPGPGLGPLPAAAAQQRQHRRYDRCRGGESVGEVQRVGRAGQGRGGRGGEQGDQGNARRGGVHQAVVVCRQGPHPGGGRFRGLRGKGEGLRSGFCLGRLLRRFLGLGLHMVHGHLGGQQVGGVEFDAQQLLGGRDVFFADGAPRPGGFGLGPLQLCPGGGQGALGLRGVQPAVKGQLVRKCRHGAFCFPQRRPIRLDLILQGAQAAALFAQVLQGGLRAGQQARLVVAALVQGAAQPLFRLAVGQGLVAGGDQGQDALFQFGVLVHGQAALADHGAALVDRPRHAGEPFPGILTGHALHRGGGAGVDGGKTAHGGAARGGVPGQHQRPLPVQHRHPPLHGRAVPGGVAVFLRQGAPLPAGQAVKHGPQKGEPGGFSSLVRRLQHVQPGPQAQGLIVQTAEGGCELL